MHYVPEQVTEIEQGYEAVLRELDDLTISLVRDSPPLLKVKRAQEYLDHGVCRRLRIIRRCIQNIFSVFPPDRTELLSEDERSDVEISLHAFVINIYGAPDNLAWIYVLEKGIVLTPSRVGLFKKETQEHLPQEVRGYLRSRTINEWHGKYAKDYRDALAHRIPLYVPPWSCTPAQGERYKELEAMISEEMTRCNFDQVQKFSDEQDAIRSVCLTFLHSFSDDRAFPPVYFHSQVIADARTVMEIIRVVRPCLDKALGKQAESQGWVGRVSGLFCWFRSLIKKVSQ
ncbi:MAG: hypothetical protein Q7U76_17710 [Nitrospirota bacterium]|nr:hypothetical protein [Nitrospirota bacterium]